MDTFDLRPIELAPKVPVAKHVTFVDGLARSGKFLTCRILSHLKGLEHWKFQSAIEHICYLHILRGVDPKVSAPLLQFTVEMAVYDRMLGRFLNTRTGDASNIYLSPDHAEYLARGEREGGMEAVERFNAENRSPVFQVHNSLPAIDLMIQSMPWMKMVHVNRHPVDQSYKWFERGWGVREAEDPTSFVLLVKNGDNPVPFFAADWADEYLSKGPLERAVLSVMLLQDWDDKGYDSLSEAEQKKHVFRFPLEGLFGDPMSVIKGLEEFFDREAHPAMGDILIEERCPRPDVRDKRREYFDEIKETVSADTAERLLEASRAYERRWGIQGFMD